MTAMSELPGLHPHDDRLLPADPAVRDLARRLSQQVRDLPIISPHGHVPVEWIEGNIPFTDPTALLLSPDHYIFRLLHAAGVPLGSLGVGDQTLTPAESRAAWRAFCERWALFRGTPSRFWMESVLSSIFGVTQRPSAESADAIYDRVAECLTSDEYRPRELFKSFGIDVLATTDDPCADLAHHAALAADPSFDGRVVPTFRPDRYLEPGRPGFSQLMDRLAEASGEDTGDFPGYLRALAQRRRHFKEHGAVSADHSHADVVTLELAPSEAARIYAAALRGETSTEESTALRRHMMVEMAQMSVDDGLVMTLHPGVHRNHHSPTLKAFGPDTGHDIPVAVEFTRSLQPLLDRFGTAPGLHLVLFTVDETVFSREIAPLAGFYPAVYAGVPWWFLDAPEAIRRYRGAVTETLGFYRTSGFIDDTRAFCSIPARHDMSRRLDSAYLAELVVQHRLDEDEAFETGVDLVTTIPRQVFKL